MRLLRVQVPSATQTREFPCPHPGPGGLSCLVDLTRGKFVLTPGGLHCHASCCRQAANAARAFATPNSHDNHCARCRGGRYWVSCAMRAATLRATVPNPAAGPCSVASATSRISGAMRRMLRRRFPSAEPRAAVGFPYPGLASARTPRSPRVRGRGGAMRHISSGLLTAKPPRWRTWV